MGGRRKIGIPPSYQATLSDLRRGVSPEVLADLGEPIDADGVLIAPPVPIDQPDPPPEEPPHVRDPDMLEVDPDGVVIPIDAEVFYRLTPEARAKNLAHHPSGGGEGIEPLEPNDHNDNTIA